MPCVARRLIRFYTTAIHSPQTLTWSFPDLTGFVTGQVTTIALHVLAASPRVAGRKLRCDVEAAMDDVLLAKEWRARICPRPPRVHVGRGGSGARMFRLMSCAVWRKFLDILERRVHAPPQTPPHVGPHRQCRFPVCTTLLPTPQGCGQPARWAVPELHTLEGLTRRLRRLAQTERRTFRTDGKQVLLDIYFWLPNTVFPVTSRGTGMLPALGPGDEAERITLLSDKEVVILQMLSKGMSNKLIGEALFISDKTISTYKGRLLEKLGISSLAGLIEFATVHRLSD